ncbi:MAG: PIG-L deacetylase family protein [Chloroflexota bacterium]
MTLNTLLCIFAHPDDELYTAGLLAMLASKGVAVHLLCLTRGENGAPGMPRIAADADLGEIRGREMACAAQALGASSLTFMNYIDRLDETGGMTEPAHDAATLRAELQAQIRRLSPQAVLTHGSDGEYGHPAHKLLHRLVKEAVFEMAEGERPFLYSFMAHFIGQPYLDEVNHSDPADYLIDVRAFQESHVLPMLTCHWTQASWWAHLKSEKLGRPVTIKEAWRKRPFEGIQRQSPPTPTGTDPLGEWLNQHAI